MKSPRILVPVDFSPCSVTAVEAAAVLARRSGANVSITHIVPPRDTGFVSIEPMYLPPRMAETLYQEQLRHAEKELAELADRARALCSAEAVRTEIVSGEPIEEIVRLGDEAADMIVMGSHGLSGAVRFLLGSVAEKVSRRSNCPVLVVPERDSDDEERLPRFDRIVAAVDYGPATPGVVRMATGLAAPIGTLHLVHVWTPPLFPTLTATGASTELTSSLDEQRGHEVRRLEEFAATELQDVGDSTKVETYVGSGHVIEQLIERADEVDADVIVMGAHRREGIVERVLGTVADRVLRHAERPVMLVPTPV